MEQRLDIIIKTDNNEQAYEIWNACFRNLDSKKRVKTDVIYFDEKENKINSLEINFDLVDFYKIAHILNSLVALGVIGRETCLEQFKKED